MTREEIKSIIQEVTCKECGAVHGYGEHQDMIEQATTKIMGGMQQGKNNDVNECSCKDGSAYAINRICQECNGVVPVRIL